MSGLRKLIISGFIVFSFLSMIRIHLPLHQPFISLVYLPVDKVLSFFSIYQTWTMFSPSPSRANVYVTATVHFDDGSQDTYTLPRNRDLSFLERYVYGERFRVITEAIRKDDGEFMWRDTAKFALRQLRDKNFYKIPVKVDLFRHWYLTPDMKKQFIPHVTNYENFESYKFFTYEVL